MQPKTTYNNAYTYGSPRPHAPTKIGVQNLAYDGDGNQTASTGTFEVGREVTWNELDQLAKEVDSSFTNTFIYNSAGERTHKRRTSLETVYVNPYYVIRSLLFQTKHIYAGPTRILSATVTLNDFRKLTTTQTPILFYYHSDQLGSASYITDRTGQILEHEEYLPSGESWIEELKNSSGFNRLPWQFNAKELDETGLYYYGARYYNPRAGVWMSPDPAFDGAFGSPMGMARYTYAHNNPVRFTDPLGLSAKSGSWTAEDDTNHGGTIGGESAALGIRVSGPGTANAHIAPSVSKFDDLRPIEPAYTAGDSLTGPDDGGGGVSGVGRLNGSNGATSTRKEPSPGYVSGFEILSAATLPFSFEFAAVEAGTELEAAQALARAAKLNFSRLPHAADAAVARAGIGSAAEARATLRAFSSDVNAGRFTTIIKDARNADRLIVPFQNNTAAVFRSINGRLELRTVLDLGADGLPATTGETGRFAFGTGSFSGNPMTDHFGFKLKVAGEDAAYLYLPLATKQAQARVARSIDVTGAIEGYNGPDIRIESRRAWSSARNRDYRVVVVAPRIEPVCVVA